MASKLQSEVLTIIDDKHWAWPVVVKTLHDVTHGHKLLRLDPTTPLRSSWDRFKNAPMIIVHWESKDRSGGAIIEEILEIQPDFNVSQRIAILTTDPVHEDVIYFSELTLKNIIRIRNRDADIQAWTAELQQKVKAAFEFSIDSEEEQLRKLIYQIECMPKNAPTEVADKIRFKFNKLIPRPESAARTLDILALLEYKTGHIDTAIKLWHQALDKNPNYFQAQNHLTKFYRDTQQFDKAIALMQKLQSQNKSCVRRLVSMGEIHLEAEDEKKAEHYFAAALERDGFCNAALNGMAEIKFRQGQLDEARDLLSKSMIAYRCAQRLNQQGISMVKLGKFKLALDHYSKAQYVLPQQEKGPQLFFNIALCYARWGRYRMAREFLKLSLVKAPGYKKAERLLSDLATRFETDKAA